MTRMTTTTKKSAANMVCRIVITFLPMISKEMTVTATAVNGRLFLGVMARKIGRAYRQRLGGNLRCHALVLWHGSA